VNIKRSIVIRVRVIFILVALAAAAIPYKVAVVQLIEGEKWKAKAEQVNFQYRKVPATRGNIYASDGSLLATSLPFYQVAIDPLVLEDKKFKDGLDSLAVLLANFYQDKSATAYKRMLQDARTSQKRYLMVNRRQIDYQDMQLMRSWPIFKEGRVGGGVIFEKIERRYQPFNSLASRTLGTLNQDGVGSGIEYSFNDGGLRARRLEAARSHEVVQRERLAEYQATVDAALRAAFTRLDGLDRALPLVAEQVRLSVSESTTARSQLVTGQSSLRQLVEAEIENYRARDREISLQAERHLLLLTIAARTGALAKHIGLFHFSER